MTNRPLILDLFCGAGGSAEGYHRAGFDVIGIDIKKQKHYPFPFIKADALFPPINFSKFDAIHASPPCQAYSITRHSHNNKHPDLLDETRELLESTGLPWVIENVPGTPMRSPVTVCGASLRLCVYDEDLGKILWLKRHRLFESSENLTVPPCVCSGKTIGGVYGGGPSNRNSNSNRGGYTPSLPVRRRLMDIDWMPSRQLSQAVPPAYTEHIGKQLLASIR